MGQSLGSRILLAFSFAVLMASMPAVAECVPSPPGLVSWWPGDGNPEDIESGYDGGNVAVSTNDGTSWTLLIPEGGYPDNSINGLEIGFKEAFRKLNFPDKCTCLYLCYLEFA